MDGTVEANTATEVTSTPAPASETTTQEPGTESQDQPSAKPAGFDPVDFKTATPEEIEARVNRLYGNVKRTEKENKEYRQTIDILTRQFQELQQGQQQIVQHIQTNDYQDTETTLRQQQRTAWDKGDLDGYHSATEKLIEVKTQKAITDRQPKPEKPIQNNNLQQGRAISATQALEMSVASGETPPDEARILHAYFGEKDDSGNLKRPWVNGDDVRYSQVSNIGRVVFDPNHPTFGSWNLSQKLAEVDRQMGLRSSAQQGSNVLPAGGLTRTNKTNTVKLSADEERIALRTKFAAANPKLKPEQRASLTDADHIEAYRQAKMKHSSKGSR